MNILQITQNKNLQKMFVADFISSFGSVFLGMCMTLKIYRDTSNLILASLIPFITLMGNVIFTPVISNMKIRHSFRTLFFSGEILSALFVLCFLLIRNIYILLAIYISFQIVFFALEAFRAEYLRINASDAEIFKWQSMSRVVNGLVPVVANATAGYVMLKFNYENLVLSVGIIYVLAAFVILFIDKNQYPSNLSDEQQRVTMKDFFVNEGKKKNEIYFGTFTILCLGSAASIVTLSYIVKFLGESDGRYGFLMASLSFGGVVGSMLVNAPFIQKRLPLFSRAGTLFMGLLLLSVLLKPGYNALLGILFVSGMVSSIIMTYYNIEIYKLYEPSEIRFQFSKFSIVSNVAQGISRPIGAFGDKMLGPIYSLASIGGLFVLLSLLLNGMHSAQNIEINTSEMG